ncbi:MAG: hypothetical protein OEU92_29070 [Alphaproteobacteria bacterium]|nr:hypothetical protein [Alphaproteobacteria bacterium]
MSAISKLAPIAFGAVAACLSFGSVAMELDIEKAHSTAIQNCINWNGDSREYCSCVQDRIRAGLSGDSYAAMMQYAQAYEESRRADLAAMQVNAELSRALEPVDAVVNEAQQACKG